MLHYSIRVNGGEWEKVTQDVMFDWTPCNFGGSRTWLLCPHCAERVAVLYGAGKYFLCRHCHDLTYASQQEGSAGRLMRRARNIRNRLGGGDNLFDPFPAKPKHMHWRTYWAMRRQSMQSEMESLEIVESKLDGLR